METRRFAFKLTASVLSGLLILNPIVAAAAELAVDAAAGGNTTVGAAGNGVPVVNIATPNGAGLSHNKFTDYNVSPSGLILNNATDKTQLTKQGGMIIGNPNLRGGAASKILNEVTGPNPSQLRGYTEVAGQAAHVIVANPHGITCAGCGFINTPRATLTTGKPLVENGHLRGYDVNGGEIAIEGTGLNGLEQDRFELIARATRLNADLHANQLTVVSGRNQVDAETLAATAKADDGSAKPQLAIDSSALGGMYAGAIRLVGTEQGVGVKLAGNMAASAGDIQIDANGQLNLARTSAAGSLRARAQDIALDGPAHAAGNVELSASGQLNNRGQTSAGSRLQVQAAQVNNSGILEAGVNPDNSRNAQGDVAITAQAVRNSGSVVASRTLAIDANATLDNASGASLRGTHTTINATTLSNQGRVLASDGLSLSGQQLGNVGGEVSASFIQVQGGHLDNRLGLFTAAQALSLNLGSLDNSQQGTLSSRGVLFAQVGGALDNSQGGRLLSDGSQQVRGGRLNNQGGGLISSLSDLAVQVEELDNRGGRIRADAGLQLSGGRLDNRDQGLVSAGRHLQLDLDTLDNAGALHSDASLTLNARLASNALGGQIAAKGPLVAQVERFEQNGGELLSEASLQVIAQQLINRQGGWIGAMNGIDLRVRELFNLGGEISSRAAVNLAVSRLDNSAGRIASDTHLLWQGDSLSNQAGSLVGQGGVTLQGATLNNSQGRVSSQGNLDLAFSGALDNHDRGQLVSEGALRVTASQVDNRAGTFSSASGLNIETGSLDNQGGQLLTDAALTLVAPTLDNRQGGVLSAKGVIDLRGASLLNSQAGRILSGADLLLAYARVDNSDKGRLEAAGRVAGQVRTLDQHAGGYLIGTRGIDLDFAGGSLDNSAGGLLITPAELLLRNLAQLNNSGGEISSQQRFTLALNELNNRGGRIVSDGELTVRASAGTLDNSQAGVLYGKQRVTLQADSLNNSAGGTVASQGDLAATLGGHLDNQGDGALAAGGTLDVRSASLNNQAGSLSGGKDLHLVTGSVNNQNGRLTAQGQLYAQTGDLDNQAGVISGQRQLTLGTQAIDNRGGLITTQGVLDLSASRVDNRQGGELSAGGLLKLRVQQLIQQQGRLITGGDLTLDLAGGDLDNRGAVLSVGGLLRIDNLRQLDNRGGEISSQNGFQLTAASIDNGDGGRIISAQHLILNSGALRNANQGLLSGWQSLLVNAADLDNSLGGTLSSKLGSLDVSLSGALDNHGEGALVSLGDQRISAASLNNQGGYLSGQQNTHLSIAGQLDNSAGGVISAQQQLTLDQTQTELLNLGGQISAASIDLSARRLDNSGGHLISQGGLNLRLLADLLNIGPQSAIASGARLDLSAAQVVNQGGQIASQGLLQLLAGDFDNRAAGTLAAQSDLRLTLSGQLLNDQDGLVISKEGALNVSAAAIGNAGGSLQAQGHLALATSGAIANQGGRLLSQAGNVQISSASLDNSAGGILASLSATLRLLTGWFSNNAGITQAQHLDITASEGIDNRAGHLSAVSGDNRLSTASLDNQGGGLYAGQTLALSGDNLDNRSGQIGAASLDFSLRGALLNSAGLIESRGTLHLVAGSIDNQNGRLRALGQAGATSLSTGHLNNREGRLETANTDLVLNLGGLANDGGTFLHVGTGQFGVNAAHITQAGGRFITTGRLDITADSWSNSSVLQAGWLNLDVGQFTQTASGQLLASQALTGRGGNWTNDGLLASDGTLDIQLTGSYGGAGRITSLGDLTLSASQLDIGQGASVTGGQNLSLGAGTLNNHGRITAAGTLTANTGTLNNYGTFGSAGPLRINTWDLLNDGQQNGALLFSGDDMTLRVGGTLTNRFADIYSLGSLDIAADDAGGWTTRIENLTGNMESAGDMTISSSSIVNKKDQFALGQKLVSGYITVRCYDCSGDHYNVDYVLKEWYEGGVEESTGGSYISSGRDLRLTGGDVANIGGAISAAGDISIDAQNFLNQGVGAGAAIRTLTFNTGSVTDGTVERFIGNVVLPYNGANHPDPATFYYLVGDDFKTGTITPIVLPNITLHAYKNEAGDLFRPDYVPNWDANTYDPDNVLPVPSELYQYALVSDFFEYTSGGAVSSAVIQAAGAISINAAQRLENSVVLPGIRYEGGAPQLVDTHVDGKSQPVVVVLDSHLPPDLTQQQVNPISLPGFSLPSGDNGLFRLSGQAGTQAGAHTVEGGERYSFAGQSIDLSQRERTLDADGRLVSGVDVTNGASAQASTGGASFSVAQVQGVPSSARPDNSHKYLIETNPELTSLKSFLSSDYLLGLLGYDPDKSQKRLGDGLYEQRLIRDAIVARTGQRYIAGITDDENLFKYLMDNAIAYQDKVHLSLGVALSAEQVAALTHDLVWLEEATVNGEKVLVPVLYLAQTDGRLGPNGALIQGQNLSLISGGDLVNQGTLRASGDLAASAVNLSNSGLIEAAGRLDLLALDSLKNTQGGIITGREVSIAALTGDVINQRIVTVHEGGIGNRTWTQSFADSAARIEAAGHLDISAGRDINNPGGVIRSGGDLTMQAGRDIHLTSAELENGQTHGRNYSQSTEQLIGEISAGRDLQIDAGRDLNAIATHIDATRDAAINAGRDVTLASAADEQHSYSQSKKVTAQEDHVQQQSTTLNAGGDVLIAAGQDLTLISSKVSAGNEAYLVAGDKIQVLAANDSDYSLYDKKDKGSWGQKKTRRDEVTDVNAVGSEISAGSDITLLSGGDQTYQAAKLDAGNDIAILSGGAVTFEAVKDQHQESHEKSDKDLSWQSSSGKGHTDETVRQSQLIADGNIAIKAVDGLKIDYRHLDQKSVSEAIDAMVKADPNLAWIKDAEQRGDVDWRAVQELHDSYKYSHSGMGPATQLAVAIAAAAIGGWAAAGALSGAGVAGGTFAMGAGVGAAGSLASSTAVNLINNKGDLSKVLTGDTLKQAAIASLVGGMTAEYFNDLSGATTNTRVVGGKTIAQLNTWDGIGSFAANQGMQNVTSAALSKALDQGGSFNDALKHSLYNTFAAAGFNQVGNVGMPAGSAPNVAMHALMGGIASVVSGGDFATGAAAAGANEALVASLDGTFSHLSPDAREQLLTTSSQLVGLLAVVASNQDASGEQLQTGAWVAQNSTQYNYLNHTQLAALEKESSECKAKGTCAEVKEKFRSLSVANDDQLASVCAASPAMCIEQYNYLVNERKDNQLKIEDIYSNDEIPLSIKMDLPRYNLQNANATGAVVQAGVAQNLVEKGVSQENASLAAAIFAAVVGGMAGKAKATDPLKVLPAPRQIEASWGANTYKHGGLMTGIEHIFYRHGPDSGFSNTGKYSAGTAVKDVSSYVDSALRYGKVTPNGPGGYVVEYNVGKTIGVDLFGKPTSILQVNVRDGVIHTAFPK